MIDWSGGVAFVQNKKTTPKQNKTKNQTGLQRWEASRRRWLHHATIPGRGGGGGGTNFTTTSTTSTTTTSTTQAVPTHNNNINNKTVAIPLDVDEIIDILFAPRWRGGSVPTTTEVPVPVPPPIPPHTGTPTSPTSTADGTVENDENNNNISSPPQSQSHLVQEVPPPSFPVNVPLPQMVDVLVDLWEAEGLDL